MYVLEVTLKTPEGRRELLAKLNVEGDAKVHSVKILKINCKNNILNSFIIIFLPTYAHAETLLHPATASPSPPPQLHKAQLLLPGP